MPKLAAAALVCSMFALTACGGNADDASQAEAAADADLEAGTTAADMSSTTEGAGDMSSAAGAGAATAAMDGGPAGDDGPPPVGEGEGGPGDALQGEQEPDR